MSRCLVTLTQHNFSLDKSQTRAINLFLQQNLVLGFPCNQSPQKEEVVATKLKGVGGIKALLKGAIVSCSTCKISTTAVCSQKLVIKS